MSKIKFLSIILLFIAINSFAQTYSGGSGTYANPYLISSKADMLALADAVKNGNTYMNQFFRLTQNLTGFNAVSTSVGALVMISTTGGGGFSQSSEGSFCGAFDGNGYEIELNNAPAGVFGRIYYATIQNLGVSGTVSISTSSNNYLYAGGICGYSENSKIAYCYNTATVSANHSNTSTNISPETYTGGICGYSEGTIITNCYNMGAISCSSYYYCSSGGICGTKEASCNILCCYNAGNISAVCLASISRYSDSYAGGIAGQAESHPTIQQSTIQNCFSTNTNIEAKLDGGSQNGTRMGRIAPNYYNTSELSNNYASSSMMINGSTVNDSDATSGNGAGTSLANLKSQSWIQSNLGWDFDAVWQMSSGSSAFQGFPVFGNSTKPPIQYTITAKARNNGTISPTGESKVDLGESISYTFTPNSGFQIYRVLIDGSDNSAAVSSGSYTFTEVTRDHSIEVIFRPDSPPAFSGGQGTKSSPYLISSRADMLALAAAVESGTTYADKFLRLTRNLTGSNAVSTSIGDYSISSSFEGVFDGDGHEIELNKTPTGVFGYISNATIQNLGVSGMISISSSLSNNILYTGGICGYSRNSTITYCYNIAIISVSSTSASITYTGGICGLTYTTIITDCFNGGDISSGSYNTCHSGGICGYSDRGAILNCYNTGNISAVSQVSYTTFAGGICAYAYVNGDQLSIKNCFSANVSIEAKYNNEKQNSSCTRRIVGYIIYDNYELSNNYALSGMTINGSMINDSDVTSENGTGTSLVNFKSQSWIQSNLGWDFDAVWQMSSSSSVFQGFPVFKTFTITASADANGSISPSGSVSVTHGGNQTFTFTPNTGYEIDNVLIDGTSNASAITTGSYTFTNITSDHTISVTFKLKQYTITASAGANGSISPSGNISVTHGNSQTFTFIPNNGFLIDNVLIDGISNTTAISSGKWTFQNISENHTISVTFKPECLSNIVAQVWDDVLSVSNNPANNGGYTFVTYQWLKNGVEMPGEISGNLYLANEADKNMSQYTCRMTTSTGQVLQTCPLQSTLRSDISAYPNPSQGIVIIESPTLEKGDRIDVYALTGNLVKQYLANPRQTEIDLRGLPEGTYIVKVNGKQVKVILL